MSNFIAPDKARTWLDGDMFRAPALTALPADIFAATLTGWDAFGGIKAGFALSTDRDIAEIPVWNNRSGAPYKRQKKEPKPAFAVRCVDYSKATVLTLLRGGSVAETALASGIFEMIEGADEEFGVIFRVYDGAHKKAYYVAKAELTTIPNEEMGTDNEDVEGFDFEIGPLSPGAGLKAIRRFLTENPLAA